MTKTIEAIYENGVIKPIVHLPIQEHKKIIITIKIIDSEIPQSIEDLLCKPSASLSQYAIGNNDTNIGDFNGEDID
jgi:predicted DNA-binding antitoxin AbrB/MazE fold protein